VRPRHAERLARELLETMSTQTKRRLGEKYLSNIYGLFCSACSDARRQEIRIVDPCTLPRAPLIRKYRRGTRQPYTPENVVRLTEPQTEAGVVAALAFFTGMREGEICGLRAVISTRTPPRSAASTSGRDTSGCLSRPNADPASAPERSRSNPALAQELGGWRRG
jgi:hypothetical protein